MIYERCGRKYDVEKPEYSYVARYVLDSFFAIARGRRHVEMSPLSLSDIKDFIELYGCELDTELFIECIFTLDNEFMDERQKELKNKPSK